MLLNSLWPNQLIASCSINSVAVISKQGGFNQRIIHQQHATFEPTTEVSDLEAPIWQNAINQLDGLLNTVQVKPKSHLEIIVASDFVRYLVLPAQQMRMNQNEKNAYALAAYHDLYGAVAANWQIKLHDAAPHQPTIVAAVDKKLLAALTQLALKYQLKLTSIKPYLMCALNGLASQISKKTSQLVLVESSRLLLINLLNSQLISLKSDTVGNNWQIDLENLMHRELLLSDSAHQISRQEVLVYAPTHKNITLKDSAEWHFKLVSKPNKNTLNKRTINQNAAYKNSLSDQYFAMLELAT